MAVNTDKAVVIGASAGALDALDKILPSLPASFPWPVIIVVHIPPNKDSVLHELFQNRCALPVCEILDKEPLVGGKIYFAPPDYHVLVESKSLLALSAEEPVFFSRPSIDVLFETAADIFENDLIGVILTGANNDGANGLRSICNAGGMGLVQQPDTALSPVMPEAALAACPHALCLELPEIAAYLKNAAEKS